MRYRAEYRPRRLSTAASYLRYMMRKSSPTMKLVLLTLNNHTIVSAVHGAIYIGSTLS